MLISLKHKLAFLAVPKTGTTAIEAALAKHATISFGGPARVKHMGAMQFETMMRPYLAGVGASDVQTMAIMRDPIDHLQSWYFYRRRLDEMRPRKLQNSTRDLTLAEFVDGYLAEDRPDFASVGTQAVFLCGRRRLEKATGASVKPLVDIIFPYERLDDALRFVGDRLGETIEIERKNTSKRETVDLPPALRVRLEDRLAPDLALHKRVLAGEFYPAK